MKTFRANFLVVTAIFSIFGLLMFFTSPTMGDFIWSDAPRHALNGIFIKDLLMDFPLQNPKEYAINYYIQYPALTILFYPPLFSVFLASSYSLFGFSHATAQATVAFFHVLLAFGMYFLARRWMSHGYAITAALILVAAPELANWGRQVMLDIPAYAWLAFMSVVFVNYLDHSRPKDLYLSVILLLCALYTKQTPVFVLGAMVISAISSRGIGLFKDRHVWIASGMFAILIIPLAVMYLYFGQVNTESVLGGSRADTSRLSLSAWLYYATQLPSQLGWPTVVLAITYLVGAAYIPSWRIPRAHMVFLTAWFITGYFFFSYIMVRESRHDLMILLPLPIFAVLAVKHLFEKIQPKIGIVLLWCIVANSVGWSVYAHSVPYVRGYDKVARFVMDHSPKDSIVLFVGNRDGTFVFNMRAGDRPDMGVARADKWLLQVAIERERGVHDKGISTEQIEAMIQRYAVRYVVAQSDFWLDLPSMRAIDGLLHDQARFKPVFRIAPEANVPITDRELVVYEYLGEIASHPASMSIGILGNSHKLGEK
jgi:hypothetical protein